MKISKYFLCFLVVLSILAVPFSVFAESSVVSSDASNIWEFDAPPYSSFDASDSYNFYRAQRYVETNILPKTNLYNKFLICNVQNKHYTNAYNGPTLNSVDNNVIYTFLLYEENDEDFLDYYSSYNSSGLLSVIVNDYRQGYSRGFIHCGYIYLDSNGYNHYLFSTEGTTKVTICSGDVFNSNAPFFGFDIGTDYSMLEYISSGTIYKDHVHIIEPNFFQTARILRKTLKSTLPEIVPVGISVISLVVLLVVFHRWRGSLLRAFRV